MSNLWLEHLNRRARGRKYGGQVLRYGAVCKDGWNSLYVSSLGALVRIVRYVTHHRWYSPWRSSLRCTNNPIHVYVLDVLFEMFDSDTLT